MDRARAAALVMLALLAYLPALGAGFIWDDDQYVTANPLLREPGGLVRIWTEPTASPQYYPLVFTTFWVEHHLFDRHALPYHLGNVLLHAASGLLLWRLLVRLRPAGLEGEELAWVAWGAAAAFVLHPVCVESVAWITERKNTLSLALYLAATHAWQRFAPADEGIGDRPRWGWYAAALALFLGALLSKTVTSTWPCAILVLAWWKRGRVPAKEAALLAPALVLGVAFGLFTAWLERTHVGAEWSLGAGTRVLLAGRIACFYAWTLVAPVQLSFVHHRWSLDPLEPSLFVGTPLVAIALGVLVALRARLGRGPLCAALLFLGTLFPALGFVDVYPFRFSWVADHFQYHALPAPLAALVTGGALATRRLPAESRWQRGALLASWLVGLGVLSFLHAGTFRDPETLWRATLERNPTAWLAHQNLGNLLVDRAAARYQAGESQAAMALTSEACDHYEEAVRLCPDDVFIRLGLAEAMSRLGRPGADAHFQAAIALEPDAPQPHASYARHLEVTGRGDEAAAERAKAEAAAAALRSRPR